MKKIIIYDTNILYNLNEPFYINEFKKHKINCYIPSIVINELKGQKIREILTKYNSIKDSIHDKSIISYIDIKDNTEINKFELKADQEVEKYVSIYFGDNIIDLELSIELIMKVMQRLKFKKRPFNDNEKASDKGFMDTLIWLSILEYSSNVSDTEIYFLTNDSKEFINNKSVLEREFNSSKNTNKIVFITDKTIRVKFPEFIDETEKAINNIDNTKFDIIEIPKEKIIEYNEVVNQFLYSEEKTQYNDEGYPERNFKFSNILSRDQVEDLCEYISNNYNDYIFDQFIDFDCIFDKLNIEHKKSRYRISHQIFESFIKSYNEIKYKFPQVYSTFINYLTRKLNEMVEISHNVFDDFDLPF